eukprot:s408_g9.t1
MAGRSEDQSQSGNVLLYVMVAIYVFLLMMVAKIAHSRKKRVAADEGEVKAHFGGSFGALTLFLTTFSTVYSGFTVTGIPNEAFSKGFVSVRWVGATLVIVAGMLLLYPRLRRLADRYGTRRLRLLSACCGIIPMVIYITAQMISFAAMVEGMTLQLIPKYVSMLIFCTLILTLEVLGGMNSVVLTDVVQCIVMIASFLVVGGVLAAEYGSIPEIGPADCSFLESVSKNATDAYSVPGPCVGPNCVAAGCIAAVKPEFYQFPSRSTLCDIIFFLINMLAAPLQPHMVQRAYIASSDANLRIVMAAMLLAPFVAQPPGIVIGLTKRPFQYFLVTLMTCSCLAAIMSTADSALMGASSIVSLDIFKKTLFPSMSKKNVVRIGELNSVLVCGLAFLLGMFLSDDQMGVIIIFQNGMLMQLLPAFGFGLYLQVSERPVCAGILAGLISLVILTITGNPLDGYVPPVNVSVFVNFLVVGLMCLVAPGTGETAKLDVAQIRTLMATSREPKLVLVALMVGIALISTPWYGAVGSMDLMLWGAPRWAIIQLLSFVAIFLLGLLAALLWKPPRPEASKASEKVTGVAPSEAETASTEQEAPKVKMNREVQILQGLSNPRIVNLHAVHRTKQWVFLVMELVRGGELFDVIVSNKTLNEVEAKYIFRQLLEGVGYMHSKNVIHRDLKPENILIAASRELPPPLTGTLREVKIADFGLSKIINEGSSFAKTFVGTPQYWAPEVLNVQRGGGSYTQAADYWSLGAVLFVMLGGRYPFDGKAMPLEEQIRTASYSMTSAAWQRVSEEAKDMVRGLLKVNPLERLKLEDCMVHPWLTGGIPGVPGSFQGPDSKVTVTEVSSGKPTATVPVVEHPSHSDVSARSESGGSRQKMEATKSGGSNTKASGSEESPQGQNKQVPIVFAGSECEKDDDQDLIFCLNELLKLQVSIASSLEVACLAFRHADRDLSDNIRRAFNEANKLSSKAATVVSNYAQVAQQVSRNILPDLKLAIQEKEPNLAVSLLGIVKDWVANMKKDGEQIQHLYSDLQENVHDLILGAQRAKSGADRRLAESLQEQVADFGGPHQVLALPEGQAQQRPRATTAEGINLQKAPSNVVPGGSSVPQSLKPRAPDEHQRGEESNCAVSVPSTMNMWTRHLFDHLTAVEDSAKNGEGRSDFIMLQSGANDSTPTADNYEAWKLDVLDLLFMAPGVGRSTLPKPEPFQHQALPRVESSIEPQGMEADRSVSSGRQRIDSSVEDVPMEEAETEDAIVQYHPSSAPMNEDAFVNQTSGSLLRALRELKRVDEILQGCSAFWSNMDGTVQKLAQMKEHTECLVNFANSSKPLRERFEQRLGEYTSFWSSLERLCRQYCMDHQAFSKQMHAMMREVSDAADFMDTAQSARLGVAMGYREKQLRQGVGGSINLE